MLKNEGFKTIAPQLRIRCVLPANLRPLFLGHLQTMHVILLVGAALNFIGAIKLFAESLKTRHDLPGDVQDYLQLKLFTAGTAAVFGCMYLFLYYHTAYAIPFLVFGAALKAWALVLSSTLYLMRRLSLRRLLEFGVSNGAVGTLFWWYIAANS